MIYANWSAYVKSKPSLHFVAVVVFCLLTVGMTWPLILQLNTHVTPGQQPALTVPYLNLWTLAWNHYWLQGAADSYWDANHFFPHQKTLAYSEPQLGTALLTFPVVLLGGSTVLAYNLALLIFFFGAGMAVYALCWWLFGLVKEIRQTQRCIASITAGILYAFAPYMFLELGVLQLLATVFPPLCLLGLHRFFYQKRLSDALLFITSFLGCWYTCAYYGLFLSVFVFCFTIGFWHVDLFHKRNLLRGLVTVAILILGLLPLANGMHSAKASLSLDRSEETIRALSAVFMKYIQFPSSSLLYGQILGVGLEDSLFFGGMLFCLAIVGIITIFRSPLCDTDSKTPAINYQKRPSLRRCGIFYISMAGLAFLLSLGLTLAPTYTKGLGIYRILVWLSPYNLLYKFVLGFSSIRSPHRFSIFIVLFLVILAGMAILWLCFCVRSRWRWVLIITLISMTIFELWPTPLRLVRVPNTGTELPRIYEHIRKLPSDAVLIHFPLPTSLSEQGLEATSRYMYFSTFHWHPMVNGYSGFAPNSWMELVSVLAKSSPKFLLSALKAFGVQYVVVHWNNITEQEKLLLRTLEVEENLKPLFREANQHTLYQIENSQHKDFKAEFPDLTHVAIYESEQSQAVVMLHLYYQIGADRAVLITPWSNRIECEVSWYRNLDSEKDSEPILVKNIPYQRSNLLHASANSIAIEVPAPAPGKYQVVIKYRLASRSVTKTGICEIYPQGFVRFHEANFL